MNKLKTMVITAALALPFTMTVQANTDAQIELRQQHFQDVKKAFGPIADTMKGKLDFDLASMQENAGKMHALALELMDVYSVEAKGGDTKDAVWSNKSDFDQKMQKFADDTHQLAQFDGNFKEFRGLAGQVAQNCKSCHDQYKK